MSRRERREPGLLQVRLFGPPRIIRNGTEMPMPPRKPATALKILALRGGLVHQHKLAGWLWPDEDPSIALPRIRDVLAKARRATGAHIQQRNEAIRVIDQLDCDIVKFIHLASRAIARIDSPQEVNRLAIQAQSLWVGPPLEEDRYEPWAQTPLRQATELQRQLWKLLPDTDHRTRTD
ncbi:MAG TPA: hypothetical protein VNU01_02820 [Egibacteraceae bacterium]|nr:hypothetical protein [Egibacteraceae bacterium]